MKLKDKKIELLQQMTTRDNEGFAQTTLEPICPPLWAYFRQLSGKERFAGMTVVADEALLTINYRTDINTTHVIRYNGELYDITQADVFDRYKRDAALYCKTRAR